MGRLQIDLVDLNAVKVKQDQVTYRYVLVIVDVMSRFLWLRALPDKTSETVAEKLKLIFMQFGTPAKIQNDNGAEFQGAVKVLCETESIKHIRGRPHYPQSQGKVSLIFTSGTRSVSTHLSYQTHLLVYSEFVLKFQLQ